MPQDIIREERTSYGTLLVRKNWEMRLWELIVFLLPFFVIMSLYEARTPAFMTSTVLAAIVSLFGTPYVYQHIKRPRYVLTAGELCIFLGNRETRYPLTHVSRTHDLPHFVRLNGKKRPLLVSNTFLQDLFDQLDQKNKQIKR